MKECLENEGGCGKMVIVASLLLALGMIGGGYMLAQGDYAPKVDLSNFNSTPNIYVSSIPPDHEISVSATATKEVTPDLLQIMIRIETSDLSASESQSRNANLTNELLAKLDALGIPDDKIQTTSYSVSPDYESDYVCDDTYYDYCHWDYELVGYQTTQMITVDIEQLDKGGSVIDATADVGINETFVDSVYYTLKETTKSELAKTLLKEAATAAKAKAEKIAEGLGISLGEVLSASENSYFYPYYYNSYKTMASAAYDSSEAGTTLSPGQVDMSASVSVSYAVDN